MHNDCTVFKTTDFIGKKWTLLILFELYKGRDVKRYGELKKALLNITPKILSVRLKELESQGLINKQIDTKEFPVKTFYSLTESGKDFFRVILEIKKWGLKWKIRNDACSKLNCKYCSL
ncbi:MAG: helix-turn-helix domain-containing protein [Nanoarchaeota archaeon]